MTVTSEHQTIIEHACRQLAGATPPRVQDMAEAAGWTASQFTRRFKQHVGVTPRDFASACRMDKFRKALDAGQTVTDALYAAGFGSSSRLYEKSDRELGMAPSNFAKGGAGVTMHYTTVESTLGWLITAATDRGICCVQFAATSHQAVEDLRARFPAASLQASPASAQLHAWAAHLRDWLAAPGALPDLPLDLRGTAFQRKVWRHLQSIPTGETRSYSQVARDIGHPKAVRAVGTACGSNRVAVLVPCHRVLRGDGALGGYRWGLDTKQALLHAEARTG